MPADNVHEFPHPTADDTAIVLDPAEHALALQPYSDGRLWDERTVLVEIHAHTENLIHSAFEIGRRLIWTKEVKGHGAFTEWCQANLPFSERTVRNYMRVAAFLTDHPALLKPLGRAGLKKTLLLTTLPRETVDEMVLDGHLAEVPIEELGTTPYIELKRQVTRLSAEKAELETQVAAVESALDKTRSTLAEKTVEETHVDEYAEGMLNDKWAAFNELMDSIGASINIVTGRWADIEPERRARIVGMVEAMVHHVNHERLVLRSQLGEEVFGYEYQECLRNAGQVGLPIPDERVLPFFDEGAGDDQGQG